jgi:glycosyltransferase involved in cell wall biosynthesis
VSLLRALRNQTFQDFELVVMIDGSTDQTQEVVEATETIFSKTIVFQVNQGRAIVKNNGAKHAKGDILIFYDDDMEPASDSVERHVHFHNTVTGILSGNCLELESTEKTDIQNYKVSLTKKWMLKYSEGISELSKESLFFTAANCSMRKTLFYELNGFDEQLTDAEDYELALRALQSGLNVYFDKSNFAIHHDMISCQRYIKRQREYKRGRVQVQQLHPYIGLVPNIKPSALKRFVYDVLARPIFPKLIDSFNVFLILPKSLRYKLYSAVIYAHAEI